MVTHRCGRQELRSYQPSQSRTRKIAPAHRSLGGIHDADARVELELERVEAEGGSPSPMDFRAASLSVQSWKKTLMRVRSPAPSTAIASALVKYACASSVTSRCLVGSSISTPMRCVADHAPRYPSRQDEKLNQHPLNSGGRGALSPLPRKQRAIRAMSPPR